MNTNNLTQAEKLKRKFLLWMPLFILPLLTLLLWANGIIGTSKKQPTPNQNGGINLQLPTARPIGDSN